MSALTASERIDIVHHKNRPTIHDYIPLLFDEFCELHGDRLFGDDQAILGGIANFRGIPITVIAEVKGRNLEENKRSNFAMPHPEGYRKALRLAKQAEKFHRPVVCFIDTPGAFCGVAAEERGQGEAIARNLMEFSRLKTPVISIVLGEGSSGGALALGVCDELAMLENIPSYRRAVLRVFYGRTPHGKRRRRTGCALRRRILQSFRCATSSSRSRPAARTTIRSRLRRTFRIIFSALYRELCKKRLQSCSTADIINLEKSGNLMKGSIDRRAYLCNGSF